MDQRINTALLGVIAVLTAANTAMIGMGSSSSSDSGGQSSSANEKKESNITATKRDRSPNRNSRNDPSQPRNKQQQPKPQNPPTTIEFEKYNHDFGTVQAGSKVTKEFQFTNTGDKAYVIQKADGSCGCTVPKYPRKPIQPGETGKITVNYNPSKRVSGMQNNSVTLVGNTEPRKTKLRIKAKVQKGG